MSIYATQVSLSGNYSDLCDSFMLEGQRYDSKTADHFERLTCSSNRTNNDVTYYIEALLSDFMLDDPKDSQVLNLRL